MTEADYDFLFAFVRRRSGLSLGPEKRYLVDSRLAPICQSGGFGDLAGLVAALRTQPNASLATAVIDALATHETFFFRDRPVFDVLRDTILPELLLARPDRPVRLWSAAASTGQEAYSLAILAADMIGGGWADRVAITATDMVASVVERGRDGLYSQLEVQRGLPVRALLDHFRQRDLAWQVSQDIRDVVTWRVLNLFDELGALGRFEVIFCRNLLIYLDGPTKRDLLRRLAACLAPGGALCLGSAETTVGLSAEWLPHPNARGFFVRAGEAAALRLRGGASALRA